MDDLVKRLRAEDPETGLRHSIAFEAADRIEELNRAFEAYATEMLARVDELERVLKEIADYSRHGWTMQTEIAKEALEAQS